MTPDLTLIALCGFAFLAGFIDAVVGGGGLVQVPALLLVVWPVQVVRLVFESR